MLYVRYDLAAIKKDLKVPALAHGPATMWRYAGVLPDASPVTLGEGFTPMLSSREYPGVYIKDEGLNPTGSFKARGMSAAVTMARAYGLKKLAAPSAGNAASALAAYCAAAAIEAHIFMPKDVPMANRVECESYGAHVTLVDGLISDCARMVAERKDREGWFDVSTLKEPFRVEGKKTMGYEVAEQFNWKLPAGIIYPTGGGVGLLGMWKAFEEMEALGWIGPERPRMVVIQATGCAPMVKAWEEGKSSSEFWQSAQTSAAGLRVPKPYGDYIILDILKKSGGTALAVTDDEIMDALGHWARTRGSLSPPQKGRQLWWRIANCARADSSATDDSVVLFNTGSGLKYLDVIEAAKKQAAAKPASREIGGIIGPTESCELSAVGKARPMTERLYYSDSFLYEFDAQVVDIMPGARPALVLDRSAFYPTTGGQLFDTGVILSADTSERLCVVDVTDGENGEVLHFLESIPQLQKGSRIRGSVDSVRRRDHMQQHSGQHVLSAAFIRLHEIHTVSFHMAVDYCSIDLDTKSLTAAQIASAEALANEIVSEARAVTMRYVTQDEAKALGLRKLPPAERDRLRLIEVSDFDLSACGGTHVSHTGQIGCILLRKAEKVRQGWRVEFVCGQRAVSTARRDYTALADAATLLSTQVWDVPAQVRKIQEDGRSMRRGQSTLLEDLAAEQAKALLAETPESNGRKVVVRAFGAARP